MDILAAVYRNKLLNLFIKEFIISLELHINTISTDYS